jgi:hypothetical protein
MHACVAVIVLSARVHPGESNASWMLLGMLQALLADTPDSRWLLARYVFKVSASLLRMYVVLALTVVGRDALAGGADAEP